MGYARMNQRRGGNSSRNDSYRSGQERSSNQTVGGSLSSRFSQLERDRRQTNVSGGRGHQQQQQQGGQRQRMPFEQGNEASGSSRRGGRGGDVRVGGRGRPGTSMGGAVRKPRMNRRSNNMMDVDEVPSGRPVGRFPMTTTEGGKKVGGRGGNRRGGAAGRGGSRGGRGGRGGNRGGRKNGGPISKDSLDQDLDSYMMKDTNAAKTNLDADLENYMMGVSDIPQTIG